MAICTKDPELSGEDITKINTVLKETGAVEVNDMPLPEGYVEEEND